jgi:hypothetical protein
MECSRPNRAPRENVAKHIAERNLEWSHILRSIKRPIASIGLLLVMALSLTGCIHLDRNVTLNGDGSGTYVLTIGINDQLLSLSGGQLTSSMDNFGDQAKQNGGSYRRYEDAGYTDWAYTRPFKSIADLNKLIQETPQSDGGLGAPGASSPSGQDTISFSEQSGFLSNSFHVTGHMSMVFPTGSTDTGGIDVSSYLKDIRESFSVTMPGSISSHKGGVVSGNTVTYTIHYGEETDVDVVGSGFNTSVLFPLGAGAGVSLLALLAVVGFIFWRRNANRNRPAPQAVYAGVDAQSPAPSSSWSPTAPTIPSIPSDAPTMQGTETPNE